MGSVQFFIFNMRNLFVSIQMFICFFKKITFFHFCWLYLTGYIFLVTCHFIWLSSLNTLVLLNNISDTCYIYFLDWFSSNGFLFSGQPTSKSFILLLQSCKFFLMIFHLFFDFHFHFRVKTTNYRISRPIRRTFFPKKLDLNSICILCAEGKYYFQTYKYPYIYYTTSLSWDSENNHEDNFSGSDDDFLSFCDE